MNTSFLLRRVLPAWNGPEYQLNAVFPRGRVQSPKVRAFIDFLMERFDYDADYMQLQCPDKRRECQQAQHRAADAARAELQRASRIGDTLRDADIAPREPVLA